MAEKEKRKQIKHLFDDYIFIYKGKLLELAKTNLCI